tara:strand:- start:328 stop:474 length:147 start_codon:yes stop_codon:yes gene_type:complete
MKIAVVIRRIVRTLKKEPVQRSKKIDDWTLKPWVDRPKEDKNELEWRD